MKRSRCASAAAILTLATSPGAHAQETPTFPASRDVVRVDVAVLDGKGQAVTGLSAADFEVRSDGKPVAITTLEEVVVSPRTTVDEAVGLGPVSVAVAAPPAETRAFLFFFDDMHLSPTGAENARRALEPVLAQQVRPGDWVTVVSASGVRWTGRTAEELKLLPRLLPALTASRQLHVMAGNMTSANAMTDYQAMQVVRFGRFHAGAAPPASEERDAKLLPSNDAAAKLNPGPKGGTSRQMEARKFAQDSEQLAEATRRYAEAQHRIGRVLEAAKRAVRSFEGFRGRKSAFVYSEGFIKSPDITGYDELAALARRMHTTLYTIDPRRLTTGAQTLENSLGTDDRPSIANQQEETGGSDYVAFATGGRASRATDPTTLFREVAVEASSYYFVGFDPPTGGAGERKLEIRVRRPGVRVRAVDRYTVAEAAAAVPPVTVDDALASVFDSVDVPMRVGAAAAADQPGATVVAVLFERKATDGERTLDFRIEARPLGKGEPVRDGGEITLPPADRPAMAKRTLSLGPGFWQARVVARDRQTGAVGSVLHTFEVGAPPAGS
jgi:VWFA-related protein